MGPARSQPETARLAWSDWRSIVRLLACEVNDDAASFAATAGATRGRRSELRGRAAAGGKRPGVRRVPHQK